MSNTSRTPLFDRLPGSLRRSGLQSHGARRQKRHSHRWPIALALVLACGSLAACQQNEKIGPTLVMDTQYYDASENYIEIPALVLPKEVEADPGVTAINEALEELKAEYVPLLTALEDGASPYMSGYLFENHCLLYPTDTGRYLCLTFLREEFHTDLNTAHVFTLVYDREAGQQVTLADALALAGQTEDELYRALASQYDPLLGEDVPGADLCIQNQALEGFRMGMDGQPVFYLTARTDDRDDSVQDAVSGADNLYVWEEGVFTRYDQYVLEPEPLVSAEECLELDPPLWWQWHFADGTPKGGFSSENGTR